MDGASGVKGKKIGRTLAYLAQRIHVAAAALYTAAAVQIDNVNNTGGFCSASYGRLLVAGRRQISLSLQIIITW